MFFKVEKIYCDCCKKPFGYIDEKVKIKDTVSYCFYCLQAAEILQMYLSTKKIKPFYIYQTEKLELESTGMKTKFYVNNYLLSDFNLFIKQLEEEAH